MLNALDNPAQAQSLAKAAYARASERFTADQMVSQTIGVYEELLCASAEFPRLSRDTAAAARVNAERKTA